LALSFIETNEQRPISIHRMRRHYGEQPYHGGKYRIAIFVDAFLLPASFSNAWPREPKLNPCFIL
jgi:hypothetical protein